MRTNFPISNRQFPVNFEFNNFKFENSIIIWNLETGDWRF